MTKVAANPRHLRYPPRLGGMVAIGGFVANPGANRPRRILLWGLKIIGLAAVVAFLVRHPDVAEAAVRALMATRLDWWLLAFASLLLGQAAAAWRVQTLLRESGFKENLGRLWVEMVQSVGLSAIVAGLGVLYRIERIFRRTGSLDNAAAAVLVDRLFGMAALILFGAVAYLFSSGARVEVGINPFRVAMLAAGAALFGVATVVLFRRTARAMWQRIAPIAATFKKPQIGRAHV